MWNFPTVVRLAYLIRFRSISQGILSQELPVRAMDGQLLFADSMGSWTLSYNCSYTVCGREMPVVYEVDSNLTLCATPRLEICDHPKQLNPNKNETALFKGIEGFHLLESMRLICRN